MGEEGGAEEVVAEDGDAKEVGTEGPRYGGIE